MKTLIVALLGFAMFACTPQNHVSVATEYGNAPQWGPAGYENARYYYLPDIEVYYDVQYSVFIYYYDNSWVRRTYLPSRYRNYDLYRGYKVVVTDYRGDSPYTNFNKHKNQYKKGYRDSDQRTIGVRTVNSDNHRKVTKEIRTVKDVERTDRNKNAKVKDRSPQKNSESNKRTDKKTTNKTNNGRR